ncbi:hypothetical protein [Streptomyces sp. SID3212]|uniref:hypothetical protein n=1 Tax=Streptomyces sp. SID3212 TaxID=2690259 RepID=UPI0013706AB4|nr:hypothetical protein [Streptomyces sp. SID3212]MYV56469.1 hypothetical protein [Streptomyces sp. SID3212]
MTTGEPQLVVYRWRCPYCTDGDMGPSQGRCLHCDGTGLTNDVDSWPEEQLVPAPVPPGVMRRPCADCAYRVGSPEMEANGACLPEDMPFWCHHGMPHGYGQSYQALGTYRPAGAARTIPLGELLCAGWWALQTGRPLPVEPFRDTDIPKEKHVAIENTSTPSSREVFGLLAMATGETNALIAGQERAGQAQLVHSDQVPTDLRSPREEFEALGFVFGEPTPADPLFMSATLPAGWKREASDHDMWSYVVDEHGRRRVRLFYRAAFYDRRASMDLLSVDRYVADQLYYGKPVVSDDTWATPQAIVEVARAGADKAERQRVEWASRDGLDAVKLAAESAAERDGYQTLLDQYAPAAPEGAGR